MADNKKSMNLLQKGQQAPDFLLPNQEEKSVSLKDFQGQWIVLYFYPKDNTSGCTLEAIEFSNAKEAFEKNNAIIIGVSPDSVKSHCNFINKHNLKILLLSDKEHTVIEAYGAWRLKKVCGKESMGVVRSTFLIDPQGMIQASWDNVKVKNHVDEVKQTLLKIPSS